MKLNFKNILLGLPKNICVVSGFLLMVCILLFPQLSLQYIGNLSVSAVEKTSNEYWEQAAVQECSNLTFEIEKIYCVNDFLSYHFKYDESHPSLKRINQSFYGDCEGSTIFYVTTLKLLNISAVPNVVMFDDFNHVFAIAYYDDSEVNRRGYCILEQGFIDCIRMGD